MLPARRPARPGPTASSTRAAPVVGAAGSWLVLGAALVAALSIAGPAGAQAVPVATADATAAAATTASATNDCTLLWQVTPVPAPGAGETPHLRLRLRFQAGPRNQTALHLPGGWSGLDEDAADGPPRLRALPGEPGWRSLAHAPGETVQLQWRTRAGTTGDTGGQVQLTPAWWAFSGLAVLPMPDGADEAGTGTACIALQPPVGMSAGPEGSRWASSHGVSDGPSLLIRLGPAAIPLAQRVQQALYAGGALQLARAPGVTAVLPAAVPWPLQPAALARAGARALAAQQRQWPAPGAAPPDSTAPWLLLALPTAGLPPAPANSPTARPPGATATAATATAATTAATAASAWHQALALQLPAGWAGDEPALERQLAPAVARAWLAGRFGPLAHAGRGDEMLRTWFSEGWADFLAHRSLLRDGLWSADDYAATLNASIAAYLAEPARNLPTAQLLQQAQGAIGDAQPGRAAQLAQLQAQRGEWLALQWHQALRRAGQPGLDAALRRQLVPAAQARREGPISAPLATHRLLATLRSVLADQPMRDLQQHIDQGQPFDFHADTLGPCFTLAGSDRSVPPSYRAVPGALQQADCQAWLGVGVPADMVVPVRTRADGTSATVCKSVRVAGKARKGSRGAKAAQVVTRCHPAAAEVAAGAPGSRAAKAAARGQVGGAKAGSRAGAAKAKSAGKPGAQGGKKATGKTVKPATRNASKPARSAR